MDISDIVVFYTILTILAVITWMTGVSLVVIEFFREFRGAKYENTSMETEKFTLWKQRRNSQFRKGISIMIIGFSLHALLLIVQYSFRV